MKKLIFFAVVLALIMGGGNVGFAQEKQGGPSLTFSGQASVKADMFSGNASSDDVYSTIKVNFAHLNVDFSDKGDFTNNDNSTNTVGGRIRLFAFPLAIANWQYYGIANGYGSGYAAAPHAFIWWRPVQWLKIQLGNNPNGMWGGAMITGWGYTAEAQDSVAIDNDSVEMENGAWRRAIWMGFTDGFNRMGLMLNFIPINNKFHINVGLPLAGYDYNNQDPTAGRLNNKNYNIKDTYTKFHLNTIYVVDNVGMLRVTFNAASGGLSPDSDASPGIIQTSFYFDKAIPDLLLDVGMQYRIPAENGMTPGFGMGLGLNYKKDDFRVKFRAGVTGLGGKAVWITPATGSPYKSGIDTPEIGVGVLPSYNFGPVRAFMNLGLGIKNEGLSEWFVNPYVSTWVGNMAFFAGLKMYQEQLNSDTASDSTKALKWAIPIGFNYYF